MAAAPPREGNSTFCGFFLDFMTKVAQFEEQAEAGKRLLTRFHKELVRLCEDGLMDHINKVKTLLQELECLVKDAHGITSTATLSALEVSESSSTDNKLNNESGFIEDEKQEDQLDNNVSFVTLMIIVHNMLKLDYIMQEKTVNALSLKTPLTELEGYCLASCGVCARTWMTM